MGKAAGACCQHSKSGNGVGHSTWCGAGYTFGGGVLGLKTVAQSSDHVSV